MRAALSRAARCTLPTRTVNFDFQQVFATGILKAATQELFTKKCCDRILYLKNSEINSFQIFPYSLNKEKKTNSSLKTLEYNVPKRISNVVKELENIAKTKGFLLVSSSPLTRSSYHADEDFRKLQDARKKQLECQQQQ